MLTPLLEKCGWLEAFIRCYLEKLPWLKKRIKKKKRLQVKQLNKIAWNTYQERIKSIIGENQIVLVHSSIDGLANIGVTAENLLELLLALEKKGNTIVLPTFPVTNLKKPTPKSLPYDPNKTLCWTGLLPNIFLSVPGVVRSVFPYNSLAALGPLSKEMMEHNEESLYVYDDKSDWAFCVKHHAKILFVGSPACNSNTIAIHMVPDMMGKQWPIDDWYEDITYRVCINGKVSEKKIKVQNGIWYKYVMSKMAMRRLRDCNLLSEEYIENCYLGFVQDSYEMCNYMITQCKQGKLMYHIPKKYYKRQTKK